MNKNRIIGDAQSFKGVFDKNSKTAIMISSNITNPLSGCRSIRVIGIAVKSRA